MVPVHWRHSAVLLGRILPGLVLLLLFVGTAVVVEAGGGWLVGDGQTATPGIAVAGSGISRVGIVATGIAPEERKEREENLLNVGR